MSPFESPPAAMVVLCVMMVGRVVSCERCRAKHWTYSSRTTRRHSSYKCARPLSMCGCPWGNVRLQAWWGLACLNDGARSKLTLEIGESVPTRLVVPSWLYTPV